LPPNGGVLPGQALQAVRPRDKWCFSGSGFPVKNRRSCDVRVGRGKVRPTESWSG